MSIKAIIPSGQTEITVNGLHQWDYGQELEIHSPDLPALIEVHFACSGMTEAVVRSCAAVDVEDSDDKIATASIPDMCLEQTSPIVAWVYYQGDTSGYTAITIKMPIIARTKPAPSDTIPTSVSDKYTEAIDAMNTQIDNLKSGSITVGRATKATNADYATYVLGTVDRATNADYANTANRAYSAADADDAERLLYTFVKKGTYEVGGVIAEENFIEANTRYRVNGYEGISNENGTEIRFGDLSASGGTMNVIGGTIEYTDDEGVVLKEFLYFKLNKSGGFTQPFADEGITSFELTIAKGERVHFNETEGEEEAE